jgi:hypothetical protein
MLERRQGILCRNTTASASSTKVWTGSRAKRRFERR